MGKNAAIEKYLFVNELPSFFRELADALEHGGKDEFACVNDFNKMKIRAESGYGQIHLKAKFKSAEACEADAPARQEHAGDDSPVPSKPKYKTVKKRMKNSFKMIFTMIHDGQVPPREAVDSFLADSERMVGYPGYGDEYYEEYSQACRAFRKAYETGEPGAMTRAVDLLATLKGRCHAKYD